MAITAGTSWYMPIDFGVTEAYQRLTGNQIGAYNPLQNPRPAGLDYTNSQANVQNLNQGGAMFTNNTPASPNPALVNYTGNQYYTGDDTGGGGGGGGSNNPPTPTPINPLLEEANNYYNSLMGLANTAESNIRSQQPGIEAGINTAAQNSRNQADTQYARSGQTIAEADVSAGKRKQNAMADARQALAETLIGGNQRFGRGSDIARALGEYANVGFQKAGSSIIDTYEGVKSKILQAKTNLDEDYKNTINSIEQWKGEQLRQAQQEFQNQLLNVQSMRTQAEGDRSNLRIQALQDLSSRIDNINLMAWQYAQNAGTNAQTKYQNWVAQINAQFPGLANQALGADQALGTTISNTNLSPIAYGSPTQQAATQYLGRTSSKKDELYA